MNTKNTGMKAVLRSHAAWLVLCMAVLAVSGLAFISCSDPIGDKTESASFSITINGGGGSSLQGREVLQWDTSTDIADLVHTITLTNVSGQVIQREGVKAGQSVQLSVAPGHWDITVKAFLGEVLKAEGFAGADLKPGPNGVVSVTMGPPGGEKNIVSIAVTTHPKTQYNLGEELDTTGMVVTATYSDGITAVVTDYTLSGYDKNTVGNHTITVTYNGKTAEFTVNVINPALPTVATPTATPSGGEVADNTPITLTTATAGAAIYYTQNGTAPSTASVLYSDSSKPTITANQLTLKFYAVKAGMNDSDIVTVVYTIAPSTFTAAPELTLEPDNGKIICTWTASNPAADSYDVYWKVGTDLSAADVKTGIKITGAESGKEITGLTNGTAYCVLVTANKAGYASINSAVETATPAMVYKITGSGAAFTATKSGATVGTAGQPIQDVINAIRTDADGAVCVIHFGEGTTLDIGTNNASFNNTGGTWGLVELSGKITSAITNQNSGTIVIANNVSVTSTADIANTAASNGNAIYHNSTGTVTISGGTVQATGDTMSFAVQNKSTTGTVTISGGTVQATGAYNMAVQNSSTGTVTISGGTVQAKYNAVQNDSTGTVTISGGTVSATTGYAVRNYSTGKITVSQAPGATTLITSANTGILTPGTICISSTSGLYTDECLVITGGTVKNTSPEGCAVGIGNNNGKITVSQAPGATTLITSANTKTDQGTINIIGGNTADERLVITGGTVENTSITTGNAVRNNSSGVVTISGGTISKAGEGNYAVYRAGTGAVTISSGATIVGNNYGVP